MKKRVRVTASFSIDLYEDGKFFFDPEDVTNGVTKFLSKGKMKIVPLKLRSAGQCGQCNRELMEPFEVGAHGDKYCVGCYRYLTQEDV